MPQSIKHPTLDFGSGHGLMVCEFHIWLCPDSVEPAWYLLSLPVSAVSPLAHVCALSLSLLFSKINKLKKKKREIKLHL